MTLPSSDIDRNAEPVLPAVVFRGSKLLCREFSLVLEARGIEHEVRESGGYWVLTVPPSLVHQAYDEINRYSAERNVPRGAPTLIEPFPGAAIGAVGYALILLVTAYCAGIGLFGADWLSLGALDAGAAREWWRALTALTLHLDQEHLMGNLLFGAVAGIAAGRLLGPGVAWASILGAGALANNAHVDVLGHALGFLFGVGVGWIYARAEIPRNRGRRLQIVTGAGAALLVGAAWLLALR